ncbi:beta-mannosidase [Alicyclobacillus kakegawensis]|uniref:beta-mannosidase n=1 Tax=Alicyclobacillus kakegawensis TaxID=392012 RepID=UPI000835FDE9|nr:glycoside hydrolase family 2 protein [Alicyclobacillus kakegawensis]
MKINENWKMNWFDPGASNDVKVANPDYDDRGWLNVDVPGDVHSTLIRHQVIEHPFFGYNDQRCRWVEEKVWWYRTEFYWEESLGTDERVELIFEGLDTFATVYLNGLELASSDNMFVGLTLDVTHELVMGRNVIAIKFDPIAERLRDKNLGYWSAFSGERIWTRKAQMNFGWDWGPRLVTTGIWKDVHIEKRRLAKIQSVAVRTLSATETRATLLITVDVDVLGRYGGSDDLTALSPRLRASIKLEQAGTCVMAQEQVVCSQQVEFTVHVENPKLWWTHDMGTPNLYKLVTELLVEGEAVDHSECEVGIRLLEVRQKNEQGQPVFTFILNGVPVFAKGANWIPVDSFFASSPDTRYQHLVRLAREAGMNMLRVWGGGIYEKDVFYQECNRQGILVWQDFMFACALYPDFNREFMESVAAEIRHTVLRLRNHPCLALWCGNNENDWIYERGRSSGEITTPFYGERIYHQLIPDILAELDPDHFYWPSSPYGGNDHNSAEEGDRHNWQVWHGQTYPRRFGEPDRVDYSVEGVSFRHYGHDEARFVSEFGIHAVANRYTLERWIPKGQLYWESPELAYRNKDSHPEKGLRMMEGYTGLPFTLDEYMDFSMLTQAEGLKFGVEHYRRRKFQTSGALIWQLNDCWPGTSWSIIDYHLLPKAAYYYAKRFYHPVLLMARFEPYGEVSFWVVHDGRDPYTDEIQVDVVDFHGTVRWSRRIPVRDVCNESVCVGHFNREELLQGGPEDFVALRIGSATGQAYENFYYFRAHKELRLPETHITWRVDPEKGIVTITTTNHARMVKLEFSQPMVLCSDNYFDLIAGETRIIHIEHLEEEPVRFDGLRVSAMNSKKEQGRQEKLRE